MRFRVHAPSWLFPRAPGCSGPCFRWRSPRFLVVLAYSLGMRSLNRIRCYLIRTRVILESVMRSLCSGTILKNWLLVDLAKRLFLLTDPASSWLLTNDGVSTSRTSVARYRNPFTCTVMPQTLAQVVPYTVTLHMYCCGQTCGSFRLFTTTSQQQAGLQQH
jgi:hypothetical protein